MTAEPVFFDPRATVDIRTRCLPHWRQDRVTVAVTWRLADALPFERLHEWRAERAAWVRAHPQPWDDATEEAYHATFSDRIEEWLDAGAGNCVLRDPVVRSFLDATLLHGDGTAYNLHAFVTMPNHVHALFSPNAGQTWDRIVSVWKRVSAHRINRALGRRGTVWQDECWDRLVRNDRHHAASAKYIRENPVRARLQVGEFTLFDERTGKR